MNDPTPFLDFLGIAAGLLDISVGLVQSLLSPAVSVVGRIFAVISSILGTVILFDPPEM